MAGNGRANPARSGNSSDSLPAIYHLPFTIHRLEEPNLNFTAYEDNFAAENLPARELWPDLINLEKLGYPERLNCARDLLDDAVSEGFGDKVVLYSHLGNWTYGH